MNTRHLFKHLAVLTVVSAAALTILTSAANFKSKSPSPASRNSNSAIETYRQLHLKELGLSEQAYNIAVKGVEKLKQNGSVSKNIISICDFSQSSNNKRLYVIDLEHNKLLFNTLVAHGKNTGEEFAQSFSNIPSSNKSSLGFYSTKGTYIGQHGLSLKLTGLEPGFNDRAEERAIVLHGADYVCDNFICQVGRLGRSFGCPSVPYELTEKIIDAIKDGSCLFVYYPDKNYLASSKVLH